MGAFSLIVVINLLNSHFMFHACITALAGIRSPLNSLNALNLLLTTTAVHASTTFIKPVNLARFASHVSKIMTSNYSVEPRGKLYTESYKLFLKNEDGQPISPFHDIPLVADAEANTYNMVVEVPRWTNAKMEISKTEPLNPIMQDVKKGKMRFVGNVFPHKGYIWNYGAFPQTWEDPKVIHPGTNCSGDNDPLDVCDISSIIVPSGSVIKVKVLGVLAMIDEGETDWKVIAINTADPLSEHMSDITDVEKYKPGILHATLEWFKYYKVPDGKPTNSFGYNNKFRNREFAVEVINETNAFWKELVCSGGESDIERKSRTVEESPFLINVDYAHEIVSSCAEYDSEAAVIEDTKATDFFFINGAEVPKVEEPVPVATEGDHQETPTEEAEVPTEAPEANGEAEGSSDADNGKAVENGEPAENGEALEADAPAENSVAHEEAVPESLPNEGAGDAVASEQPPAPVKSVEASEEPAAASGEAEAMETS